MILRNKNLIIILLLSFCIALFVEHRVLWDGYAINNDVRNQAYWMHRLQQSNLYPNDLAARYFTQPPLVSPFVYGLYWLASLWIDPIRFSQFLPFALVLLATFFLFKAASSYVNERYAFWVCLTFNLFIWMIPNMAGGLPRAFFFPLIFLFLWLSTEQRWLAVLVTCILQGLIYPPVLFLSLGVLVIDCVLKSAPSFTDRKRLTFLILTVAASGITLYLRYSFIAEPSEFGHLMHSNWAEGMDEFYIGGRVPIFQFHPPLLQEGSPLEEFYDFLMRIPPLTELLPLAITITLFLIYRRGFGQKFLGELPVPQDIWILLIVSFLYYFSASFLLFFLYVPERYIQYTFPLISVFLLGALLYKIHEVYRTSRLVTSGVILLSLLVAGIFWQDDLIKIYSDQKAVFSYLEQLPANTMIAASYPILANDIPVFSQRSVLVNREITVPFHCHYYKIMKQRLKDWLDAYYTSNPNVIRHFIDTYKIDAIVISSRDYEARTIHNLHSLYFKAFSRKVVQQAVQAGTTEGYLLPKIAKSCHSFQSGPYSIIPVTCFPKTLLK